MKRVIGFFTRLCEAFLPDAFVFSLILTLIVFLLALVITPHSPVMLIEFWGKDFWSLNAFSMQMVFVLISGHMLATTPLIRKTLKALSGRIHSEPMALVFISLFSVLTCWLNWGFGLIVSGVLAIELARKLKKVNFGLFVATAYSGFVVWHGGISGSIPLKLADDDEILGRVYPQLSIPLGETIFSFSNLLILCLLLISLPLLALWMRTDEKVEINHGDEIETSSSVNGTLRATLENAWFFNAIFFMFFCIVLIQQLRQGKSADINSVNMIFLSLALLLHQRPRKFIESLQNSIAYAGGIVIQFPFYAGIMGLMQYSGLADWISQAFVQISSERTLPLWSFLSGGIVNFFIPSGGGQWVVQGPIMLKAAQDIGVSPAKVSMALAWGDAWTNLVQPFWALPLLGLARLQLKDIMGYCLIYLSFTGLVIAGVFYFAP